MASAQTTYTWTGGAGTTSAVVAGNWTPAGGPPGSTTDLTNTDRALFNNGGISIHWTVPGNSNTALGAIATTATSTGSPVDVRLTGNGNFRLNGGMTVGPFTNVALAASGSDLAIASSSPTVTFGMGPNGTQLYSAPNRVLSVTAGNISNAATAPLSIVGGGTVRLIGDLNLNNQDLRANAGTLALKGNVNQGTGVIRVASGALLQGGLAAGEAQGVGAVTFADGAGIRALIGTAGATPSVIQNGTYTKSAADHFRILLGGIDPGQPGDFAPNSVIMSGTFNGFGSNGTYTRSSPGLFQLEGNQFEVSSWSLTLTGNQLILNSFSVVPVPEPAGMLAVALLALGGWAVRRRFSFRRHAL